MSPLDPAIAARLATALAAGPGETVAALSSLFTALPGIRTVTWLATAPDRSVTHRIGSTDPKNFPIGGFDPITDSAWNLCIFGDRRAIVGNDPAAMAAFIPEAAELVALGYGAIVCAPIIIAGEVRGTVCLLADAGSFTPDILGRITALLPIAALLFTFEGISER